LEPAPAAARFWCSTDWDGEVGVVGIDE
jgi:hypothetical protein